VVSVEDGGAGCGAVEFVLCRSCVSLVRIDGANRVARTYQSHCPGRLAVTELFLGQRKGMSPGSHGKQMRMVIGVKCLHELDLSRGGGADCRGYVVLFEAKMV
jgi:hypothetical protein